MNASASVTPISQNKEASSSNKPVSKTLNAYRDLLDTATDAVMDKTARRADIYEEGLWLMINMCIGKDYMSQRAVMEAFMAVARKAPH